MLKHQQEDPLLRQACQQICWTPASRCERTLQSAAAAARASPPEAVLPTDALGEPGVAAPLLAAGDLPADAADLAAAAAEACMAIWIWLSNSTSPFLAFVEAAAGMMIGWLWSALHEWILDMSRWVCTRTSLLLWCAASKRHKQQAAGLDKTANLSSENTGWHQSSYDLSKSASQRDGVLNQRLAPAEEGLMQLPLPLQELRSPGPGCQVKHVLTCGAMPVILT